MSKKIFEEKGGPHRGHAAGATDAEKQASQLASDVKYKVKQGLNKATKLNPAQVSKAYLAQLAKSPAPPAVKALAKKKLMGEEYTQHIAENVEKFAKKSVIGALHQVFVEGVDEKKQWIVVTDKKTGNTYRRQATRAKIAELRANPNISRVEITLYHPDKDDDKKGQKTASVKAGKGLNPGAGERQEHKYGKGGKNTVGDKDQDGTVEPDGHEYAGVKDTAIKKAMAKKKKIGEDFIYTEEAKDKDSSRKTITGKGVNNKKLVKVFPDDMKEQVTSQTKSMSQPDKKDVVDPNEKKQISALQQFQRKEQQLNQQKIAAQKQGKIPVGSVQMNSYEPEGDNVDEAKAIGQARSTDVNPKGAAVRASSGRGMTMTPAKGLGASKPKGDDEARAANQASQAKKDRAAAARDRAASGEDRLSKLIRSVQNNSHEPEGEQIDEKITAKTDMGAAIKDFYASKSSQLAGRTKEQRRQAAIAAVLTARRGGKKLGEECGCEDEKEPKLKKKEGGAEDPREIPTKVNLVKNKFRAMGLKMSYEPEGDQIDEVQAPLAGPLEMRKIERRTQPQNKPSKHPYLPPSSSLVKQVKVKKKAEMQVAGYEPEGEVVSEKDEAIEAKFKRARTPHLLSQFRKQHPGSRQEPKKPGAKETEAQAQERQTHTQVRRAVKYGLTSREKAESKAREKYDSSRD